MFITDLLSKRPSPKRHRRIVPFRRSYVWGLGNGRHQTAHTKIYKNDKLQNCVLNVRTPSNLVNWCPQASSLACKLTQRKSQLQSSPNDNWKTLYSAQAYLPCVWSYSSALPSPFTMCSLPDTTSNLSLCLAYLSAPSCFTYTTRHSAQCVRSTKYFCIRSVTWLTQHEGQTHTILSCLMVTSNAGRPNK